MPMVKEAMYSSAPSNMSAAQPAASTSAMAASVSISEPKSFGCLIDKTPDAAPPAAASVRLRPSLPTRWASALYVFKAARARSSLWTTSLLVFSASAFMRWFLPGSEAQKAIRASSAAQTCPVLKGFPGWYVSLLPAHFAPARRIGPLATQQDRDRDRRSNDAGKRQRDTTNRPW